MALLYSFPNFEPVLCFMFGSNCCFLIYIQDSKKTGNMFGYSHLFKNFPLFVVIHIVKGFSPANEAEVDVFLEFPCFLYDPPNVGNLVSGSSAPSLFFFLFNWTLNYFTILWWFCHTFTWISHGCTCVPHPDPPLPFLSPFCTSGISLFTYC